ncbi:hypothetical protein [Levilactobacillus tujiorum]|uniref:hypothetical protein n=1 Tax=Levilactobacillus tujiorum TaxID=2912243 RepID=UPI00145774E2|nr:hypothetical protein [Levilactobacillus tujiorum]NLR32293.1 hypothetical protein [Levilactobacillus tujiorum]
MEAAVTTVLADDSSAYSVGRVWRSPAGFKPSRKTVSQSAGDLHSSRNLWQPQVTASDLETCEQDW